jgi:hypothetical protein
VGGERVSLLDEILQLVRVDSNAGQLQPGDHLKIDVLPSPVPLPNLGTTQVFRVQYVVERELESMPDEPEKDRWEEVTIPRLPPAPDDLGNLLSVAFALVPSVTFGPRSAPQRYRVRVLLMIVESGSPNTAVADVAAGVMSGTLKVVEGKLYKKAPDGELEEVTDEVPSYREIVVGPLEVPSIPLPTVAIISTGPWLEPTTDGHANDYVIILEPGSPLDNVAELLDTYNKVLQLIDTVKDMLQFFPALLALQGTLKIVTRLLAQTPLPPGIVVGDVLDFDVFTGTARIDGSGFDNENTSMIMLGSTRSVLRLSDLSFGEADLGALNFLPISPVDLMDVLSPKRNDDPKQRAIARYVGHSLKGCASALGAEFDLTLPFDPVDRFLPKQIGFGVVCVGDWNPDTIAQGSGVYDSIDLDNDPPDGRQVVINHLYRYHTDPSASVYQDVESAFWSVK